MMWLWIVTVLGFGVGHILTRLTYHQAQWWQPNIITGLLTTTVKRPAQNPCQPQQNWKKTPLIRRLCLRRRDYQGKPYLLLEGLTALASVLVVWHFGWSRLMPLALLLTWSLLLLAFIDIEYTLLPDIIVLPMLCLGLGLSLVPIFTDPVSAILGSGGAYLGLGVVALVYQQTTGRVGLGRGDIKLLALLGAWLGYAKLPAIVLLSSLLGASVAASLVLLNKRSYQTPLPFGPFLALAGWLGLLDLLPNPLIF